MLKRIIYGTCIGFLVYACYATSQPINDEITTSFTPRLSSEEMHEDVRQLQKILEKKHAGLYRFQTEESWKTNVQKLQQTLDTTRTLQQFYLRVSKLVASIQCGHTKVSLPEDIQKAFFAKARLFPLDISLIGDDTYVKANYSTHTPLSRGTKLLRINGEAPKVIISAIAEHLSSLSDGSNTTGKQRFIAQHFAHFYALYLNATGTFKVEYASPTTKTPQTISLKGILSTQRKEVHTTAPPLSFTLLQQPRVGLLKVLSFDQGYFRKHYISFQDTLQRIFAKLRQEGTKKLILDLRGNTGGDDTYVANFLSYFIKEPFQVYQKIEVNPGYSSYGQVKKERGMRPQIIDLPGLSQIEPKPIAFTGNVYIVMDGYTFSGASDAAALLKSHHIATTFGEESGGGYHGNNSGIMPSVTLKNSGIRIRLPLWQYSNQVTPLEGHQGGVLPDYPLTEDLSDFREGLDSWLKQVLQFLEKEADSP